MPSVSANNSIVTMCQSNFRSAGFMSNTSFINFTYIFSRNHELRHLDVCSTVMIVKEHMLLELAVAMGNILIKYCVLNLNNFVFF